MPGKKAEPEAEPATVAVHEEFVVRTDGTEPTSFVTFASYEAACDAGVAWLSTDDKATFFVISKRYVKD